MERFTKASDYHAGIELMRQEFLADVSTMKADSPHDWLFPKMAAVVHHGGAGTTAEGLRAGKTTLICPTSMNDQAFWGRRIFELGVGPKPIPQSKLTAEMLGRAIHRVVTDGGVRWRAEELGEMIRVERGVVRGEDHLREDRKQQSRVE